MSDKKKYKYDFGYDELTDSSTENQYGWKIKTDPNSVYQPDLPQMMPSHGRNSIQDIIKASREKNFVGPELQQPELGQPRSREVDPVTKQVLKTLLSIPTSSVEGMRGAGDLLQESIKGFKEGDILGGTLGTGASLLRAGFAGATPLVPMLRGFTIGTDIAGDVIGQENLEPFMAPVTHFTKPESLAGRSGAEIADLIAQLLIAKGGENAFKLGKSKLGKKDFEVPFPEGEKTTPQFQVKENEPKPIEGLTQEKNIIQDYIKKEAFKEENLTSETPQTLYHGTNADFDVFDITKAGSIQKGDWGKGIYLESSKGGADYYRIESVKRTDPKLQQLHKEYRELTENLPPKSEVDSTPAYTEESTRKLRELQQYASELDKTNKGKVLEVELSPKAKIYDYESQPGMTDPFLAESVKAKGYDVLRVDKERFTEEYVVLNPDVIKIKTPKDQPLTKASEEKVKPTSANIEQVKEIKTESDFSNNYQQHKMLRETAKEDLAKIESEGWRPEFIEESNRVRKPFESKFSMRPNVARIKTGKEKGWDSMYPNKKGEIVLFVPEDAIMHGANGDFIKPGWKPKKHEIGIVEYDNQPSFEIWNKNKSKLETQAKEKVIAEQIKAPVEIKAGEGEVRGRAKEFAKRYNEAFSSKNNEVMKQVFEESQKYLEVLGRDTKEAQQFSETFIESTLKNAKDNIKSSGEPAKGDLLGSPSSRTESPEVIKLDKEIKVSRFNIKTPGGRRPKQDITLGVGEYEKIGEGISTSYAHHGDKYIEIKDKDGNKYIIKTKELTPPPNKAVEKQPTDAIKERIYNNLQWDKNDTPTRKRALLKQAQNDAKLLREQGINADIKRGAGNKWKLVIDNKPQGKRELGLVTKTEKVKLEDVEIENPNAKKHYSELGEGKKKEQQIVAETFVEASDLPNGLGEKTLKKGIEDIKNNDGAEQSKEAQLVREAAEGVIKNGKEIKIGAGSSETEFISPKQVKEFVKEKNVVDVNDKSLDTKFIHSKWFYDGITKREAIEKLAKTSDVWLEQKDVYSKTELSGEPTGTKYYLTDGKYRYTLSDAEKALWDKLKTTEEPFDLTAPETKTKKGKSQQIEMEGLGAPSMKGADDYLKPKGKGEETTPLFEQKNEAKGQKGLFGTYASQGTKELQTQPKVISEFKASDLNDVVRLRDIGRNMTKDIGLAEGKDVRTGRKIMRRFGKMLGFYSPSTGIVRIKNMNDIGVLAHELGHKLDFEVFPETQNLRFKKGDKLEQTITLVSGYKNAQRKAKVLDTLRKKHGQAAVDSILERAELRAELKKFGGSIGKYFEKTEESIAEFISRYVTNPEEVRTKAPRFYNLFENILDQNPNIRKTLITAREQVAKFRSQDPRQITESTIARDDVTDSFLSKIKDAFDGGFFYNIVDGTKPLRDLVQKLEEKGTNIAGKDNPLLQTLSLIGVDGKAKQFLENHPFIKSGNDVKILTDKKPFFEIFKRMLHEGSLKEHEGYLTALRNIELYKNKKGQAATTTLDIAEKTKSLYEKQLGKDYLDNLTKDLRDYNQALLDYYQQSGKISPEILNSIKELNQYYVPFKRFFEEFENTGQAPNVSKYIKDSSPSPVKQIRGSQREIISPIGSIIKNTYDMIAAADRNTALKTIIESLRKVDKTLVQEIPPRTFKPVEVIRDGFTETKVGVFYEKPQGESVVTVWYDGKPKYYQIPKEYYDSFFSISDPVSKAIQTLSAPSRLLQAGAVVYDPTFAVRNIPRDQVSALFYSKYGYQPIDIVKGLFSAVKKTEAYQKFLASGADQSFLTAMDQMLTKNYMQERTGRRVQTTFQKYKRNPVEILRDLNRATELGTRVGAFKKAYLKSGDVWRAMQEGREITADYGVKGKMMTNVSPLLPFFNARIQHAKRTAQSLKQRPTQSLAKGIAFISAPSIINWFANNTDEDRRKLYNELPLWRRYGFFNIPIPGTESFLPLPKGFFGQLFGTSMEGALDWALNNEPETIKDLAGQLFQETSPLSSPIDFIPQFGRPIVEQFANKKGYTGAPIVSERLKGLDAEDQYTDATSEFAKYVGGVIGLSPARIDAFITGYTAGAGRGILNVSDEILELTGIVDGPGEDTFTRLSRMPILKAFITETPLGTRGLSVEKFYSKLDDLESLNKTVNNYIKDDNVEKLDEYLIGKEDDYIYYLNNQTEINKFKDVLRAVRDLRYQIYKDPKISDKRETIRKMEQEVTDVAIKFSESYDNKQKFNLSTTLKDILKNKKLSDKTKKKEIKKFKSIYDED